MNIKFIAAALLVLLAPPTFAQSENTVADSTSESTGIAVAHAPTFIDQRSGGGTATLRTAPSMPAPAMGSGHPCYQTRSVGLSIIGGGFSGGTEDVDYGCMMMQSGDTVAGRYYYAARDRGACVAYKAAGLISKQSDCGEEKGDGLLRPSARAATDPAPTVAVFATCYRGEDGQLRVKPKPGADPALAVSQCKTYAGG